LKSHRVSTSNPLRAAVIGAGVFGRHHAAKYMRLPGVTLSGIADPSPEARRLNGMTLRAPVLADWHELLGKVDLVSVCSPASTHAGIVRSFLAAGTHVLVEKPIATDIDEADELVKLASDIRLVLTVGHQERYVFAQSGLLDWDDAPLFIECVRAGPWTGRGADVSVVLDLMIHDLDLVHRLVPGAVANVASSGRSVHGSLPDEVAAKLEFDNGSRVELFASRVADSRRRSMRLVYADGVIEIDFLTRSVRNTTRRPLRPLALHDPLGESVAAFVTAIQAGGSALVRPEEARNALETALLIEDAALLDGAIALPEAIPMVA
jgi:predicted dehydrogenase